MNKFLEKAASLGAITGAITSTDGHRWGGAGAGFLGDVVGGTAGHAIGGFGTVRGIRLGQLTGIAGGAAAGHYYGQHAAKKDALHKRASVNSLIEDGVDFDTAVALAQKFF